MQKHDARRLHYDFRLEHEGVMVSWAVPKGVPEDPTVNHLAVQTEDHPMDYAAFEGVIPAGEYGAGTVEIWDEGTYELEKWRDGKEVIATLHGRRGSHRYALIRTRGDDWLLHLMKPATGDGGDGGDESEGSHAPSSPRTPARSTTGPDRLRPMLATTGDPDSIDESEDWVFEIKWDGIRALATVADGSVELRSRNGLDLTASYPELAELAELIDGEAVVDGEIVAIDADGRTDFSLLQDRMGLTRPRDIERARRRTPVRFLAFDLLSRDGRSLIDDAYTARRAALTELLPAGDRGSATPVQVPLDVGDDLDDALAISHDLRAEGVMAKLAGSRYRVGRRSRDWLKIKHLDALEVVVIGWRPGSGRRAGGVGSLLLALPDGEEDGLRYVGRVGTGFRDRDLAAMLPRLEKAERQTPPAHDIPDADASDARWVTPRLVAEVEFQEFTGDGRLRQASWRGWRPDKDPADVAAFHGRR